MKINLSNSNSNSKKVGQFVYTIQRLEPYICHGKVPKLVTDVRLRGGSEI